jgi:hypothetical protein
LNIRDLPPILYNKKRGYRRVNKEDRYGNKYLTHIDKHTTRTVRYELTYKKDFRNFDREVKTRIGYKNFPEIIIENPDGFTWRCPGKPDISYSSKTGEFRTPSIPNLNKQKASNQAVHIAKIMKKLGYLTLKYGRRRKRENVQAEYPCQWKELNDKK